MTKNALLATASAIAHIPDESNGAGEKIVDRLIDRHEVLRRVPVCYGSIWHWMQAGKFPRSRDIGGKSAWIEREVEEWIKTRPVRPLKGDGVNTDKPNNPRRRKQVA